MSLGYSFFGLLGRRVDSRPSCHFRRVFLEPSCVGTLQALFRWQVRYRKQVTFSNRPGSTSLGDRAIH